jgi:tRNA threonylcarbamoyladenosine biosynthesis protein TsaB
MPDLEAVAVSNGPGSYTGLRISLSTAKGICYALGIPLITVGTLEIMAMAAQKKLSSGNPEKKLLLCPMIDARRMEVYFSLYDQHLTERQKPATIILDQTSFAELLKENYIAFFGNGSQKCSQLLSNPHALFPEIPAHTANDLSMISFQYFIHQQFADISYVEPLYVKEFFTTAEKKS